MPLDTVALTVSALRMAPDAKRVTFGTSSTWGVLNDDEQFAQDDTGRVVTQRDRTVYIANGALTGITVDATLTVGDVAYTVRGRPMPRENGDVLAIPLARVDA